MRSKGKSPQEKKALSYEKDRRTFAWHSDKGLRIARHKRKATANRRTRRIVDAALDAVLRTGEAASEESGVTNALIREGLIKNPLSKISSVPLSRAIAIKHRNRQAAAGHNVRAREREAETARNVVSFLSGMSKGTTLGLISALESSSYDYMRFEKWREPDIGRVARWIQNWSRGMIQTTRPLRNDPELASEFERCVARINRVAAQRGRTNRRVSGGAG